jgi:hypothetical protein
MSEEFEDEVLMFLMKAIVVSGCAVALLPGLAGAFTPYQAKSPASGRLYLDPETGNYWVYVPGEEE